VKERILKLRQQGKSYKAIAQELNINRYQVEYYANPKKKEIMRRAGLKYRHKNPIQKKVANFHCITPINQRVCSSFPYKDFVQKIGPRPFCYLTGKPIDIHKPETYSIDHIIPVAQGGSNSLDNAGLISRRANELKMNRTPEQLLNDCHDVINFYKKGYSQDSVPHSGV